MSVVVYIAFFFNGAPRCEFVMVTLCPFLSKNNVPTLKNMLNILDNAKKRQISVVKEPHRGRTPSCSTTLYVEAGPAFCGHNNFCGLFSLGKLDFSTKI